MSLNIVELTKMVERAIRDELEEKETRKLSKILWNKYENGDITFKEKTVLVAIIDFPVNRSLRKRYIAKRLEYWRKEHKTS